MTPPLYVASQEWVPLPRSLCVVTYECFSRRSVGLQAYLEIYSVKLPVLIFNLSSHVLGHVPQVANHG